MALKIKLSVVLPVALLCISLALAGGIFYLLKQEQQKTGTLQSELNETISRQRAAEKKASDYQKNISNLEMKLQDAQMQIDSLSADLEKERSAKLVALEDAGELNKEIEQHKAIRADLEEKLKQAQEDVKRLLAQTKELDDKRIELEAKIKDLEAKPKVAAAETENVELGKIVVAPEGTVPESVSDTVRQRISPLEGKVMVVNKDYNFIVINLGSKDDVSVGEIFSIYHANKYLGDVKVEKVHDSMSAAGFVSVDMKNKISEGDKVASKTK